MIMIDINIERKIINIKNPYYLKSYYILHSILNTITDYKVTKSEYCTIKRLGNCFAGKSDEIITVEMSLKIQLQLTYFSSAKMNSKYSFVIFYQIVRVTCNFTTYSDNYILVTIEFPIKLSSFITIRITEHCNWQVLKIYSCMLSQVEILNQLVDKCQNVSLIALDTKRILR